MTSGCDWACGRGPTWWAWSGPSAWPCEDCVTAGLLRLLRTLQDFIRMWGGPGSGMECQACRPVCCCCAPPARLNSPIGEPSSSVPAFPGHCRPPKHPSFPNSPLPLGSRGPVGATDGAGRWTPAGHGRTGTAMPPGPGAGRSPLLAGHPAQPPEPPGPALLQGPRLLGLHQGRGRPAGVPPYAATGQRSAWGVGSGGHSS